MKPTFADATAAKSHETIEAPADTVLVVRFLLPLGDALIADLDFILDLIPGTGRVDRVTSAKSMTTGTFVLILA